MLAATRLAVEQKMLPPSEAARIAALIVAYGPVPPLGKLSPADLGLHLGVDKKIRDGKIHFVLPRHIGEVAMVSGIDPQQPLRVLEQVIREDPFQTARPAPRAARAIGTASPRGKKPARRAIAGGAAKP
jgi:3-dehydroquinate synthetase